MDSSKTSVCNSKKTKSVMRQKGESQNGCYKKTKHPKFSKKARTFLTPDMYQGLRNVRFSENLACIVFL